MIMAVVAEANASSFRGALLREPGIHSYRPEYGFRVCAKRRILRCAIAHRGMTARVKSSTIPGFSFSLRRPNPIAVKSVGDPVRQLHQCHRTCLDIGGVEHREIAAVFAGAPDGREQPAVSFRRVPATLDE